MEEVFEMKVQEKLQKLKDIEADVSTVISPMQRADIITLMVSTLPNSLRQINSILMCGRLQ